MPIRYGRGKFQAHQNYVRYMEDMVKNPAYRGMPNAVGKDGRVNWQVSSGKTTSFYNFYQARFNWWVKKADEMELPGEGNANDRFSLAARLIHPTKLRPCRLCGKYLDIGYMYTNKKLATRWNKIVGRELFEQKQDVREAAKLLLMELGQARFVAVMELVFKERSGIGNIKLLINDSGIDKFFVDSRHIASPYLSPGFMSNAPDRLDGFHDYGLCCRKEKDPGRSDENLRTYLHDRRAFQWWAEGDWRVADTLYYQAGPGTCEQCGMQVRKISPHHVGPLSCGFKQLPLFVPLCGPCNSSRNRRMPLKDVQYLMECERKNGGSVASWQIRAFWDKQKGSASSNEDAKEVSNILRSLEDYYLRTLYSFWKGGSAHFITTFLSPNYAHYEVQFDGLDRSTLQFKSYRKVFKKTRGTMSLAARSVRIAFEELEEYCTKIAEKRKLTKIPIKDWEKSLEGLFELAEKARCEPWSSKWIEAVDTSQNAERRERLISKLLETGYEQSVRPYAELRKKLFYHFNLVGSSLAQAHNGVHGRKQRRGLDSFF